MPSSKPVIALRLPAEMHAELLKCAEADHRTIQNFIELKLAEFLARKARSLAARAIERDKAP
jgi:hypothetical protein